MSSPCCLLPFCYLPYLSVCASLSALSVYSCLLLSSFCCINLLSPNVSPCDFNLLSFPFCSPVFLHVYSICWFLSLFSRSAPLGLNLLLFHLFPCPSPYDFYPCPCTSPFAPFWGWENKKKLANRKHDTIMGKVRKLSGVGRIGACISGWLSESTVWSVR